MSRLSIALLTLVAGCSLASGAVAPGDDTGPSDSSAGDTIIVTPPDGCVPRAETCNATDDDCDGTTDEGFDTMRDPQNCGACGTVCDPAPANGAAACSAGACDPRCDEGFANCNANAADGCEVALSVPDNCGACGMTCAAPTPFCEATPGTAAMCVAECGGATTMCPPSSCVVLDTDVLNCGACGSVCPAATNAEAECTGGMCGFRCDDGFDDCDGNPANGCETSLLDVNNCGGCGTVCSSPNAVPSCGAAGCGFVCAPGFGDCDGDTDNGCEDDLNSMTHCGACGVPCAPAGGTGDCSTGTCVPSSCTAPADDCDMDPTNGCEAATDIDEMNCGTCGSTCAGVCNGRQCYPDCGGVPCVSACASLCSCDSGTCGYVCSDPDCDARCQGSGITCTVLGNHPSRFDGTCRGGAECTFDLRFGETIGVRCENAGTDCAVDCRNATSCEVDCRNDATCTLECGGATACSFSRCDGSGMMSCGGGRIVCNRGC